MRAAYGKQPLHFETNRGQADPRVKFLSRGAGYTLFLTSTEAVVVVSGPKPQGRGKSVGLPSTEPSLKAKPDWREVERAALRLSFAGANVEPEMAGQEELPGKVNYFLGHDPSRWRINVSTYAKVRYQNLYPGIDLVYYGNQRQLEYDFVVAAGADPGRIILDFRGANRLEVDAGGDLVLHTVAGPIRQRKPVIYQEKDGVRRDISGGYVMKSPHQVSFQVAAYDRGRPLIIDPVLIYSTYLGGSGSDEADGPVVDTAGNAYVVGNTDSADFPTTAGAVQTTFAGGFLDAFVAKLSADGSALVYSTYLGGSGVDLGSGIAIDAAGRAYVTGTTTSADFPATAGAFQTTLAGSQDAFVAQLSADGSALVYSTYLGGSDGEEGDGIAVDAAGRAYVAGSTGSADFPTTAGAVQPTFGGGDEDAFVAQLSADGSALVYSTYLGGSGFDRAEGLAVDAAGRASVTGRTSSADFPTTAGAFQPTYGGGEDAFVAQLSADGLALAYSTYLGGSGQDFGGGIATDAAGRAYVIGSTSSADFPTTAGAFQTTFGGSYDAFVAQLSADGSALAYSTYLGGSGFEEGEGVAIDAAGRAYVTGRTESANFPTTAGAFQTTFGGNSDAFVVQLSQDGSALVYSTYLGGSGFEEGDGIAIDAAGGVYVAGLTDSADFPITAGAFQPTFGGGFGDAFVVKIGPSDPMTKEQCKNGGWMDFGFKNQGQCVRFVETGKDSRIGQ